MIGIFLKKIKIIFNKVLEYHKMVNFDWKIRFIGIVLLLLYLVGVLIFGKKNPYVSSSQKNKFILNDLRIERENSK